MKLYIALVVICLCLNSCFGVGWHAIWDYEGPNCMGKAKVTLTRTGMGYNATKCTPFLNSNNAGAKYAKTGCRDIGWEMIELFEVSTSETCDVVEKNFTANWGSCVTTSADSSYASQCAMDGSFNAEFLQVMGYSKATMYYPDATCSKAAVKVVMESTTKGSDDECTEANELKLNACAEVDGVYQRQMCGPITDVFFMTGIHYNRNSWDLRNSFVINANFSDGSCQTQSSGITGRVIKTDNRGQCSKDSSSEVYSQVTCGPMDGFQTRSAIYTSTNSDCSEAKVHSNTTDSICLSDSTGSSITACSNMLHPVISESFFNGVEYLAGLITFTDGWNCNPSMAQIQSFEFKPILDCAAYQLPEKVGPFAPVLNECIKMDPNFLIYVCDTPRNIFTRRMRFNFDGQATLFTPDSAPSSTTGSDPTSSSSSDDSSTSSSTSSSSSSSPSPSPSASPSSSPSSPAPPQSADPTDSPATSSASFLFSSSLFVLSSFLFSSLLF